MVASLLRRESPRRSAVGYAQGLRRPRPRAPGPPKRRSVMRPAKVRPRRSRRPHSANLRRLRADRQALGSQVVLVEFDELAVRGLGDRSTRGMRLPGDPRRLREGHAGKRLLQSPDDPVDLVPVVVQDHVRRQFRLGALARPGPTLPDPYRAHASSLPSGRKPDDRPPRHDVGLVLRLMPGSRPSTRERKFQDGGLSGAVAPQGRLSQRQRTAQRAGGGGTQLKSIIGNSKPPSP